MTARKPLALLVCGAIRREVAAVARRSGWEADVHTLPALHHLDPRRIVAAARQRLPVLQDRYDRVVMVYGDCGTAGRLDALLAEVGATRPAGAHCYEMLGGAVLEAALTECPGTFILTDWLVRAFDRVVVQALGLDRYPELQATYFAHYEAVLYLQQFPTPALTAQAERIARYLGLPLEIRPTALDEMTRRLAAVIDGAGGAPQASPPPGASACRECPAGGNRLSLQ